MPNLSDATNLFEMAPLESHFNDVEDNEVTSNLTPEDAKRFRKFYSNCSKAFHPFLASRIAENRMDVEGGNESTFVQDGMHMEISLYMTTDEIAELRKGLENHDKIWGAVKRSGGFGSLITSFFFIRGGVNSVIELINFLKKSEKLVTVLDPLYDEFYNTDDSRVNPLGGALKRIYDSEYADVPIEWAFNLVMASCPMDKIPTPSWRIANF